MNTSDLKSFYYLENGDIMFSLLDTIKSNKTLDAGCYNLSYHSGYPEGKLILKLNTNKEDTRLPSFAAKKEVDALISNFFNENISSKICALGFNHKLGILLHGKEGTGKSSILKYYYDNAIKSTGAIVFNMLCADSNIEKCWDFIKSIIKQK